MAPYYLFPNKKANTNAADKFDETCVVFLHSLLAFVDTCLKNLVPG